MAFPALRYNASTGSDTAASGAGGPSVITAITGAAGASTGVHTAGVLTNVLEVYGTPDLTAVAVDGSAVILIDTPAGGRHLTKITGITTPAAATQITVQDSFTLASGASALAWAIGGKRKTPWGDLTWNDFKDVYSGWAAELEDTADHVVLVATDTINALGGDGHFIIRPAAGHSPTIDVNGKRFMDTTTAGQHVTITGFNVKNAGSAWGGAALLYNDVSNCVFIVSSNTVVGAGMAYAVSVQGSSHVTFEKNIVDGVNQSGGAGFLAGSRASVIVRFNTIKNCLYNNIKISSGASFSSADIYNNDLLNAGGDNVDVSGALDQDGGTVNFTLNTLVGGSGDGLLATPATLGARANLCAFGNIFDGLTGVAINSSIDVALKATSGSDANHFYNNTGGDRTNFPVGPNDTSGDPLFTNRAGGDYTLQAASPVTFSVDASPA